MHAARPLAGSTLELGPPAFTVRVIRLGKKNCFFKRRIFCENMVSLRNGYLFTYNMLQAAGWAVALFQVIDGIQATGSLAGAYEKAGNTVGKNPISKSRQFTPIISISSN